MRRRWLWLLALVALALLAGRSIAAEYADQLWYTAMGAAPLWRERFWDTLIIRAGSGVLAAAFVFANLYAVRLSVAALVLPRRVANLEIGEEVPGRDLVVAAALIAVVLGWLLALPADAWQQLALARRGIPFGETDPYFELDLSFYVYWLPLEGALHLGALVTVLLTGALVAFIYSLTPGLRWDGGRLHLSRYARRHLLVIGALLLVVIAWGFRLDGFRTLLAGSGVEGSFSYSDHRALIPSNGWLSLIAASAAIAVLLLGWMGQVRAAGVMLVAFALLGIGLREVWPVVVRRMAAVGDPAMREMPYQLLRAEYSRRAFAVDHIVVGDSATGFTTPRAAATAIPAWDPATLLAVAGHRERGEALAVAWRADAEMLIAEIPVRSLVTAPDTTQPRWSVDRILASAADPDGAPVPPADGVATVAIAPDVLVYDGAPEELLIVADTNGSIPAPLLTNARARLAFGWSRQRLALLTAELPGPNPKAFGERRVRERVAAIAPFFAQGSVVSPLVSGRSLAWGIDLYSVSGTYPLSRRDSLNGGDYSYVHHAALALVDAHTGRVQLVADERPDPIAASWIRRFPALFVDRIVIPRAQVELIPPAIDGARLQARMLARYGRRGDSPPAGELPSSAVDSLPAAVRAVPFARPRPGGTAWSAPVLDANEHLTGVVVATGGAARETYWLPLASAGPRWATITGRLKIALDSSLAPTPGMRISRSDPIAVPLRGGIAFAQSAYGLRGDAPPVLLGSAVVAGTTVFTGPSVSRALGAPALGGPGAPTTPAALRAQAAVLYAQMRSALARGDWVAFGRAFDALGALLRPSERRP